MPVIWLIDDTPQWHAVTERTVAMVPGWELASFHTGPAAMMAFEELAEHRPQDLPQVVLMDFYLGQMRGDAVTEVLRDCEPAGYHVTIVGHSSMTHGSALIECAGADCSVRKHADGEGINHALLSWLTDHPLSGGAKRTSDRGRTQR